MAHNNPLQGKCWREPVTGCNCLAVQKTNTKGAVLYDINSSFYVCFPDCKPLQPLLLAFYHFHCKGGLCAILNPRVVFRNFLNSNLFKIILPGLLFTHGHKLLEMFMQW